MKCPFCDDIRSKVLDSRMTEDGACIRRRRQCLACNRRFTTYERFEESPFMVVKKDGRREKFDRQKILVGIMKACEKRPVSTEKMEEITAEVEKEVKNRGDGEIPSCVIGEIVMENLKKLDGIAYVRFASVYKEFKDVGKFAEELRYLEQRQSGEMVKKE